MATNDSSPDAPRVTPSVSYPMDDPERVATPEHRLRRELLKGTAGAAAAAVLIYLGWTRYLFPPAPPAPKGGIPLGKVSEFPAGPPKSVTGAGRPYLVENLGGSFRVLSAVCTHQGCTVAWQGIANALVCPCHGAMFDAAGKVTSAPAPRPLQSIPTHVAGDTLYALG